MGWEHRRATVVVVVRLVVVVRWLVRAGGGVSVYVHATGGQRRLSDLHYLLQRQKGGRGVVSNQTK